MSDEIKLKQKLMPYDLAPDDDVEMVIDSFRILFGEEVELIKTGPVHKGGTSGLVYVPPGHTGKLVTIIVWANKQKYVEPDKGKRESEVSDGTEAGGDTLKNGI